MRRALLFAVLVSCGGNTPPPLQPCTVIAPVVDAADAGLPADTVYGFADLHAHPGIEKSFSGRLIWGAAIDDTPPSALELPRIAACPVETHTQPGQGAIDRAIGGQVFPSLSGLAGFAHAPVNSLGLRETPAWPNARDLIHQQMNVGSIRRAYEGGLRLMFASTTDDQVIAALLTGPNFVNAFVPKTTADYDSAKRQLELILEIVSKNGTWMEVARTPAEARDIILRGKLALVLSLEMNGLEPGQPEALSADYGARHIFPIHLIDNGVGGSAATGSLFNSSGAAVSSIYRPDHQALQYMDLLPTREYATQLGRPQTFDSLSPLPVYVALQDVPYRTYASLCYEPLGYCAGTTPQAGTFTGFGQMNLRGLCRDLDECLDGGRPGAAIIDGWMDAGWLIDISHMGARSVEETVALRPDYPLIASHTDIAHLCRGTPTQPPCTDNTRVLPSERALDGEQARRVVERDGVIGFGLGNNQYDARAVLVARGAPLLSLDPTTARTACAAIGTAGCEPVPSFELADAGVQIARLQIETVGGVPPNALGAAPYVRVELRDAVTPGEYQHRVIVQPLDCSAMACSATVTLGSRATDIAPPGLACTPTLCSGASCTTDPFTLDDVESVTLQWMFGACDGGACSANLQARQCSTTWDSPEAPTWPITAVALAAQESSGGGFVPMVQLGPRSPQPFATLGDQAGTLTVYARDDRPSANADVRASGHLLKVTVTAGATGETLFGSSPQAVGPDVCVSLRKRVAGECVGPAAPGEDDTECPDGWQSLNYRGAWNPGVALFTFIRSAEPESDVCGVDVAMIDWPRSAPPLGIDSVRVDAIEDPVGHWVRRYAEISRSVGDARLGVVAVGTDFNGLNGMLDISEGAVPAGSVAPSVCGAGTATLAPLRFRNADGTLGEEVRIDERGLATYGLLADFVAIVSAHPGCGADIRDSLMLSAERTLRVWERIRGEPARPPLPRREFACDGGF